MKKFFICALAALVAVATMSSCAKDTIDTDYFEETVTATADQVFDIDLQFDAPTDLSSAVVEFYDEFGQGIAVLSVPVSEITKVTFVAGTRPTALYTDGLQNVNEDGVLPLPEESIETKAGDRPPVLLVIR